MLSVIEQITCLLFAQRLDEIHTAREKQANLLRKPIKDSSFTGDQQQLRWSRFKDLEAGEPSVEATEPPAAAVPGEFTAKVIKMVDGDTIDVLTDDNQTIRIRLNGIDCPERGQPYGNNATDTLQASILGNLVKVVSR